MYKDKQIIIDTLEAARKIISESPKLLQMDEKSIIDELDNSNSDMNNMRWAVIAYMYVDRISDYSLSALVHKLCEIDSCLVTYEYIGFILQSEHSISVIDLLLDANNEGQCIKILPFVQTNVTYEKIWNEFKSRSVLAIITDEKLKDNFRLILYNYACLTVNLDKENIVVDHVLTNHEHEYCLLLKEMINELYKKDVSSADNILLRLFNSGTRSGITLAISFAGESIYKGNRAFEQLFCRFESLAVEGEYWKLLIPVYVTFTVNYPDSLYFSQVVSRLNGIQKNSISEKEAFVCQLIYERNANQELYQILLGILSKNFQKSTVILGAADTIFYSQWEKKDKEDILDLLQTMFCVNEFSVDYQKFWESLQCIKSELKNEQSVVVSRTIKLMLSGSDSEFCFALSLIQVVVDVGDFASSAQNYLMEEAQAIDFLKGILYFVFDAPMVCTLMFQISSMINGKTDEYYKLCEEVFENYPFTSAELASKTIENNDKDTVIKLAKNILVLQKKRLESMEEGNKVLDLRPSLRRQGEYQKAKSEFNSKTMKMADSKSIFSQLSQKQVMKYGKKHAFIQYGINGDRNYSVGNYATFAYEMELPIVFMNDPLLHKTMRMEYIDKRKQHEINN